MKTSLTYRLLAGENGPLVFLVRLLLIPVQAVYLLVVTARNALYDTGLLATENVGVPVVSVGNLTVGGTGKTPLVIELARRAVAQGRKVAIVAKGYGAVADAEGHTDEVALIASRVPAARVVMALNKLAGARQAAREGADVIIVDDGLQHRRLHRDLDLVVVDARVPVSNGYVVPLGGLREPPSAMGRADLIVLTHTEGLDRDHLEDVRVGLSAYRRDVPVVLGHHRAIGVRPVGGGELAPPGSLAGQEVFLFCGIANPDGFRRTVESTGATVTGVLGFSDHHAFEPASMAAVRAVARTARLVCTEKDAAKVAAIPGNDDVLCLCIDMVIEGELPPLPGIDS